MMFISPICLPGKLPRSIEASRLTSASIQVLHGFAGHPVKGALVSALAVALRKWIVHPAVTVQPCRRMRGELGLTVGILVVPLCPGDDLLCEGTTDGSVEGRSGRALSNLPREGSPERVERR